MTYDFAPYIEYHAYQPATIAQLDRLRRWVDRVADRCDEMIDSIGHATSESQRAVEEIQKIRDLCATITTRVDSLEAHDKIVDTDLSSIKKSVSELQARISTIEASGYVTSVSFTDLDTGLQITADGTKSTSHHQLTFTGDSYTMVRVAHGQNSTTVAMSGEGGLGDPARISVKADSDENTLTMLAPNGTSIASAQVTSTDGTLHPTVTTGHIDMTLGDSLKTRLDSIDAHITDVDAKHASRPTLDDISVSASGQTSTTTYTWRTQDGSVVRSKSIKHSVETDGTITATSRTDADGSVLKLSAVDQLKRLPLLESRTSLDHDDQGLILKHHIYHPQTGAVSVDGSDHVPISGDDTISVSMSDGIHLSAQAAVDKAQSMDDAIVDTLTQKISEQTARISALSHTVSDLQTAVRTAMDVADRSVTSASLTLTGEDDDGATVTVSLLSRSGIEVARLPVTLRVKSTNRTIKAGVQTNGNVATLAIDVV